MACRARAIRRAASAYSVSSRLQSARMSTERQYALAPFFGTGHDEMASYTPHARLLGMKVIETGPAFAVIKLPYRAELIGDPVRKVVFGGAITTLIDHASGLAVACA